MDTQQQNRKMTPQQVQARAMAYMSIPQYGDHVPLARARLMILETPWKEWPKELQDYMENYLGPLIRKTDEEAEQASASEAEGDEKAASSSPTP